jgi:hypothetical protein
MGCAMEGLIARGTRLRVERRFEVSRLEKDLLASAYEHAVPEGRRTLGQKRKLPETLNVRLHVRPIAQTGA